MASGREIYLESYGFYRFNNGYIVDTVRTRDAIELNDNDIIYVAEGIRLYVGSGPCEVRLSTLLSKSELFKYEKNGHHKIDLYTLRVLELYYNNTGYAGMNVGEFMRRVMARREVEQVVSDERPNNNRV